MKNKNVSLVSIKLGYPEKKMINKVFKNNWITMGPLTEQFEYDFAKFVGAKYAVAVNSCTSALQIAVAERDLQEGDEVITTPFTWESTTTAILYAGAKPVFADIDKDSGNISLESIKKAVTNRTKGIVLIHYAGWPADMVNIMKFAKEKNLFVIEDCAHSIGTRINNKHVGTYGCAGCFSFGSTKTITTGEGGMVVTNDSDIYENLKLLRNYGSTGESYKKHLKNDRDYEILKLSYNFKINEFASAVGVAQLKRLPGYVEGRRRTMNRYYKIFSKCKNAKILYGEVASNIDVSPLFLPLVLNLNVKSKRKLLIEKLKENGIGSVVQYPVLYDLKVFRDIVGDLSGSCPVTEDLSPRILSLPCHGDVPEQSIVKMCKLVDSL